MLHAKKVTIEQGITIKEGRGRGEVEVRVEVGAGAGVVQLVEAGREIGVEDAQRVGRGGGIKGLGPCLGPGLDLCLSLGLASILRELLMRRKITSMRSKNKIDCGSSSSRNTFLISSILAHQTIIIYLLDFYTA